MRNRLRILLLVFLWIPLISYGQEGIVSGVLLHDDGNPLPGANIYVKGGSLGTLTDFDGNYRIECKVGDILVFSFVGLLNKEVVVTPEMFNGVSERGISYISVTPVTSDAYAKAVKNIKKASYTIQTVENSNITYNKNNSYFQYNRIKGIAIEKDKVNLTYFRPDVYFEVGYRPSFGVRYIRDKNLPELQRSYSQGTPLNGALSFQGAETGNIFSYGPLLNTLEFDGNTYLYDSNGALVNTGTGNGNPSSSYDNSLLETTYNNSHKVFFNISTDAELFGFDFLNENSKDIYDRERNTNNRLMASYKKKKRYNTMGWNSFITYQTIRDNQPNSNGFQNNLLLNQWATPPSFSNQQGTILPDTSQRSFSTSFNNPLWLLNNHRNMIKDRSFTASIQNDMDITNEIGLESKLSYNYTKQKQEFGVTKGTVGFENGFLSHKDIETQKINAVINFDYSGYLNNNKIGLKSIVHYNYDDLKFLFQQSSGFENFTFNNPLSSLEINQSISRNTVRLLHQFRYEIHNAWEFKFMNNSYYSSIQDNNWFLPSLSLKVDLKELFNIYGINKLLISSNTSFDINDNPLYYSNLSHNSLLIAPEESLTNTSNNDLFIDASIDLEKKENYELNASFGLYLLGGNTNVDITYYDSKTKGSVFPVIDNGVFQLKNVADIRTKGFEFTIDSRIRLGDEFYYQPTISFSTYNTETLEVADNSERIPIAGFSTVSKNLIVGESAGVLIGSAYARDNQNNVIIGDDGFPLVAATQQIIGDPVPDYNIGINNTFEWKKLELNVVVDVQKGGDIWNGTQNVLNYLGTSEQSAVERNTNNYVFAGVDQQGNANTIPVDFYNPNNPISENRFVRYGFAGVAEEAIVDASYINIKSVDISYTLFDDNDNKERFLRECRLGVYTKNIYTWSKYRGHTPYSSLYGNSSGQELNFFNTPLQSEIGLTLKLKI